MNSAPEVYAATSRNVSHTTRDCRESRITVARQAVILGLVTVLCLPVRGQTSSPETGGLHTASLSSVAVDGELKQWHRVSMTLRGPALSENATPNPFLDYRLQVTFRQGDRSFLVPGFFAADGRAADSGAEAGDRWRVYFAPEAPGRWDYRVSFRQGHELAVSDDARAGRPVEPLDGLTGSIAVGPSDKKAPDLRGKGRLKYVGRRYLQFASTGDYYIKQGADAPENLLAYQDFDGDFKNDGRKDNLVKTWEPHIRDWHEGDPSWMDGKGKGLIGAINYLASEKMNAVSFLTLNIEGDDRNVFPYTNYAERLRMDVSRLAQWEIVLSQMDRCGMHMDVKTQETENEMLLDDGEVGVERRLYYRELIARFAHHLALTWNLGEENGALGKRNQNTEQRRAMAQYLFDHDPYRHPIVIHNGRMPDDLLGPDSKLSGFSLQTNKADFSRVHSSVVNWVRRSEQAGKPWVIFCDEPGDAQHALLPDSDNPAHDNARRNALWGTLLGGGAGDQWYFGYKHDQSDLTCQDWRSRDLWWDQCRIAHEFFTRQVPFSTMAPHDDLIAPKGPYCLADPGRSYAILLPQGGPAQLDLGDSHNELNVRWFNPRRGGSLQKGSVGRIQGPGRKSLGAPPSEPDRDWVVVVMAAGGDNQ